MTSGGFTASDAVYWLCLFKDASGGFAASDAVHRALSVQRWVIVLRRVTPSAEHMPVQTRSRSDKNAAVRKALKDSA
ncbi:MAG: hypothetical protein HDR11_16800 [Lachnospiraceae bacterium]|nr:hypothetical protein [Lachnospiraceae bacterium]